jgi:glycosyltransferase involved in cell wall biosynthesis
MKFVCLLPVRDESDIIGQCLNHLLTWSDEIYVFDTGSVDNTWEIVQDFAGREKRVIPLRKEPVYFSETRLRGWMFHEARKRMKTGDWFLRVDADEFHYISPPEFIKTRLRRHETIVYHQYYNFALRESEVRAWESATDPLTERALPIEQRRQWYEVSIYAEPRLCRYRDTMQWPSSVSFPFNAGYVAEERLPIRHYPHRDPLQLERRCRLRAVMMADKENRSNWSRPEQHHWAEQEWRKFVTPDSAPDLKHWTPGTTLDEVKQTNHIAKPMRRLAQRITHAMLLPFLDQRRPHWQADSYPQLISPEIVSVLARELAS